MLIIPVAPALLIPNGEAGDFGTAEHQSIPCSNCHSILAATDETSVTASDLGARCHDCHLKLAEADAKSSLRFHQDAKRSCLDCHSFHSTSSISAEGNRFEFVYNNTGQLGECFTCHGQRENLASLSPAHKSAAALFHSNYLAPTGLTPSQLCLVCHTESSAIPPNVLPAGTAVPRFSDHGYHPLGIIVSPGARASGNRIRAQIDSRIVLFEGRIECQTCHSLTATTRWHLVEFANQTDLCQACHQLE
ncbi:MAG TPA: cytochrome c3 family protein [Candidatus Acidoferrum sp.]|nr:cytochrome c3 family protein [Candidatus Acidoferrum sp.]